MTKSAETGYPRLRTAYLLYFFPPFLALHRFYLGKWFTALLQIALNVLLVGLIWTIVDGFIMRHLVEDRRSHLEFIRKLRGDPEKLRRDVEGILSEGRAYAKLRDAIRK